MIVLVAVAGSLGLGRAEAKILWPDRHYEFVILPFARDDKIALFGAIRKSECGCMMSRLR
jgi:hypothetical protein